MKYYSVIEFETIKFENQKTDIKDGIPDDRSLGGSYNIAFFSAAIGDMIKPFELEGV